MLMKFKKAVMGLLLAVMVVQLVGCTNNNEKSQNKVIKVSSAENEYIKSSTKVSYNIMRMKPDNLVKLVSSNDEAIINDKFLYELSKQSNFIPKREFLIEDFTDKNGKLIKKEYSCKTIKGFKHTENF